MFGKQRRLNEQLQQRGAALTREKSELASALAQAASGEADSEQLCSGHHTH